MWIFWLDLDNDQSNGDKTPTNQWIQTTKDATVWLLSVTQHKVSKPQIYMRDWECSEEDQKKIDAEKARAKSYQERVRTLNFATDKQKFEIFDDLLNDSSRFEWGIDCLWEVNRNYLDIGIKYKPMSNLESLPKKQHQVRNVRREFPYRPQYRPNDEYADITIVAVSKSTLDNNPPKFKKLLDTQINAWYWVNGANNFKFRTYIADLLWENYFPTWYKSTNVLKAEIYMNCMFWQYWENVSFEGIKPNRHDQTFWDQYFTIDWKSIEKHKVLNAMIGIQKPSIWPELPYADPIASLMLSSNT